MKRLIISLLLLSLGSSVVFAEPVIEKAQEKTVVEQDENRNGIYFGLGLGTSGVDYSQPGLNMNFDGAMLIIKLGYDFNEYFGAEVRLGGTGEDKQPLGATTVEMGAGFLSAFIKPQYPISRDFRVYGLVGATNATFTREQITTTGVILLDSEISKTGFSYGVGAEYDLGDRWSLGGEWVQYWSDVELIRPGIKASIWGAVANINFYF